MVTSAATSVPVTDSCTRSPTRENDPVSVLTLKLTPSYWSSAASRTSVLSGSPEMLNSGTFFSLSEPT